MNEQNDDIEINLLRLFRYILSKFKTLILLGVVFAVLGLLINTVVLSFHPPL